MEKIKINLAGYVFLYDIYLAKKTYLSVIQS